MNGHSVVAVARARLRLGQTDRAERRVREDGGGHVVVIHDRRGLVGAAEETVGEETACGDRSWREIDPSDDVANCVHVRGARTRRLVDDDVTAIGRRDARGIEAEAIGHGLPADRMEDLIVALARAPVLERDGLEPAGRRDRVDLAADDVDAGVRHLVDEDVHHVRVHRAQRTLAADEQIHLRGRGALREGRTGRAGARRFAANWTSEPRTLRMPASSTAM